MRANAGGFECVLQGFKSSSCWAQDLALGVQVEQRAMHSQQAKGKKLIRCVGYIEGVASCPVQSTCPHPQMGAHFTVVLVAYMCSLILVSYSQYSLPHEIKGYVRSGSTPHKVHQHHCGGSSIGST